MDNSYTQTVNFVAKPGSKYLKDFLPEGRLPKNCLFDKALTGCGGTYLALTDPEPYIIAVPTKSLVRDKVNGPQYREFNVQGVSSDYPLKNRELSVYSKIIVTYKSLPALANRLDISKYNLLVDEAHLLSSMSGYARTELIWIMQNFTRFKTYCFMSATIPRREHLLEEMQDLSLIRAIWDESSPVKFNCLLAADVQKSVLKVMLEHSKGEREGTPYFFYNSVGGICNIISRWQSSGLSGTFNIVCADTSKNLDKLKSHKLTLGSPNVEADFHFITATAFEGVDFYDPEGVSYVISDGKFMTTKYSIETTIPQIVGRIRDSEYNNELTIIFDEHPPLIAKTPREYAMQLDTEEAQVKAALAKYESLKQEHREGKPVLLLLKGVLDQLLKQAFVLVHGDSEEFEDLVYASEVGPSEWPELSYYNYAKTLAQQTYDLFHEEMYVLTKEHKRSHIPTRTLASEVGTAPSLSDSDKRLFKMKREGLQPVCELYRKDKVKCQTEYPEWFPIVDTLGLTLCKSYDYSKKDLKAIYEATQKNLNPSIEDVVNRTFHVGCTYSVSYIKTVLEDAGYQKPKGTSLNRWFQTKRVVSKGVSCYKIIQRLS